MANPQCQRTSHVIFPMIAIVIGFTISSGSTARLEKRSKEIWSVTTILDPPYAINKTMHPVNNEDFDGYIPEMMRMIGAHLNQPYKLHLVRSGNYGSLDERSGKWTGMIGEVINGDATVAAAAITMSPQRSDVIDFTEPFMSFSTVILLRRSDDGADAKIKNIRELADQTRIEYGVVKDGMTEGLFRASTDPDLKRISDKLIKVDTLIIGVHRVNESKGNFAMIVEANTAEYWMKKTCIYTMVDIPELDKRHYAFVVKKHSTHRQKLNDAIDKLKNDGSLETLKNKWWKNECSGAAAGNTAKLIGSYIILTNLLVVLGAVKMAFQI